MAREMPTIGRDEAEMLVDLCENTTDKRLHWLAEYLREQWGMGRFDGKPADISYLGLKRIDE